MSTRLTTAIKIADSANAVLQRVNSFDFETARSCKGWDLKAHIGIDPMLLALAMELALKAWYVFDHDTTKVIRSHNLAKLFVGLKPESQNKLDTAFRRSVALNHPILFDTEYGILDVLEHHAEAFVDTCTKTKKRCHSIRASLLPLLKWCFKNSGRDTALNGLNLHGTA
jgi:hypothetical protein